MSGGIKLPPGFELIEDAAPQNGVKLPPGFEMIPKSDTSTIEDVARSGAAGLGKGAIGLVGLPADVGSLIQSGLDWGTRKVTGKSQEEIDAGRTFPISRETLQSATTGGLMEAATPHAPFLGYKPQTTAGEYARTIGEFAPAALAGPASLGRRAVTQALIPALASETAGQVTKGTAAEPYARVAGALAGGFLPAIAGRVISPFAASQGRQEMVNTLRREGIDDITAGQATGSKGLQYFESEMGGARAGDMVERQGEQFTRAALRRVGENAPRATADVVDNAFTRVGQQFDDLAARNTATLDPQFGQDLGQVVREYSQLVPDSHRAPIVQSTVADIAAMMQQTGQMPGPAYQALRSRLDRAARGARADPQLNDALNGIRNSLDDAMERSVSPADQAAWREARTQYRNLLVVEKAATGAGENAAMGIISPSQLRNATVNQNRRSYARGDGDFAELARAGEAIMKPLPNSGTAPRMAAHGTGALISGGVGAALGSGFGPVGSGVGAVAGALAPKLVGRAAMTRPVQAILGNQLMANTGLMADARRAAVVQAILQQRELSGKQSR